MQWKQTQFRPKDHKLAQWHRIFAFLPKYDKKTHITYWLEHIYRRGTEYDGVGMKYGMYHSNPMRLELWDFEYTDDVTRYMADWYEA